MSHYSGVPHLLRRFLGFGLYSGGLVLFRGFRNSWCSLLRHDERYSKSQRCALKDLSSVWLVSSCSRAALPARPLLNLLYMTKYTFCKPVKCESVSHGCRHVQIKKEVCGFQ